MPSPISTIAWSSSSVRSVTQVEVAVHVELDLAEDMRNASEVRWPVSARSAPERVCSRACAWCARRGLRLARWQGKHTSLSLSQEKFVLGDPSANDDFLKVGL